MERLQKIIAEAGVASRRKAEELIKAGKVKVNGKIITELGTKASEKDEIIVDGKLLEKEDKEYYLINKPRGIITSTKDDKGRSVVTDLIGTNSRIYPVGRLDYDTTGALILTNDGDFANIITHPKSNIDKVYMAKLEEIITGEAINKLKDGVKIDDEVVSSSRVKLKKVNKDNNTCMVEITIHEGKNHQVKKMFEAVGYHVEKLTRKRIGIFTIENLKSGEYRKITPKEVAIIYSLKK